MWSAVFVVVMNWFHLNSSRTRTSTMRWHHRADWLSRSTSDSHYEDNWFESWQDSNVPDGILANQTTLRWSQWPRGLRRRSAAARLLRLWVRIPQAAWVSVCCECCVLSGRVLCDELITRQEESYRLCCVIVCDLGTLWMRRPWPTEGAFVTKNKQTKNHSLHFITICYSTWKWLTATIITEQDSETYTADISHRSICKAKERHKPKRCGVLQGDGLRTMAQCSMQDMLMWGLLKIKGYHVANWAA
jgi:hypothetical protein